MWYSESVRKSALHNLLDDYLDSEKVGGISDALAGCVSSQLATTSIVSGFDLCMGIQGELEPLNRTMEAERARAQEELERLTLMPGTFAAQVNANLDGILGLARRSALSTSLETLTCFDSLRDSVIAGAAATSYDNTLAPELYTAGTVAADLRDVALQAIDRELASASAASSYSLAINSKVDILNDLAGSVGGAFGGIALDTSYLDDIRGSVSSYFTQEFEAFKQITSAAVIEAARPHTISEAYSSNRFTNKDEIERLIARHGPQFTMGQALLLEAAAHTAEKLLSTRNRCKIARKLSYISYMASFGSKILRLYTWLLLLMWRLLDSDLLDSPQLRSDKVRRSIKCLSPPPDQPLSRTPKVKPNAPNAAA